MASTTSIVCQFGDSNAASEANAFLSAEIDDRETGLNSGNTSFKPGDTAWFLVYMSANVELDGAPEISAGTLTSGQNVTGIVKEEQLTFQNSNTASISVPATSLSSTKWLGRSLGSLSLSGNKTEVTASSKGVAVAKVKYLTNAIAFGLTSPATLDGESSFGIVVVVSGKLKA